MNYTSYNGPLNPGLQSKLKRPAPLTSQQQFQFHNYTQSNIQTGHQLPPRQMNYQPPPPITEPNHKTYRGSYEMQNGIPLHGAYEDQTNNFTPQTFYRLPMDPDHREQSRLPNSESLHETRAPLPVVHVPPPLDDNRISGFHPHNNFGRPHDPSEPKNHQLGLYSTDYRQNGFASRNSSGYLSDRLGSRNSSGYLSDRSYESDRELERQNGFFMVMSDDIVSHNPDYYYYGNNGLEFSESPASLGHDLPSIADLNTNNNNNKKT